MQLGIDVQIPDGLLAANALLAENSRQGFGAWSGTVHQGFEFAISSTSLGIKGSLYDGGIGSRSTGKERDSESGLDYFGARYYASNMGRWLSPDWSESPDTVPYGNLTNPQSLNLYAYVNNNPLSNVDQDGHTHTECTGQSWDDKTNTVTATGCHDVPDWWNLIDRYSAWHKARQQEFEKRFQANQKYALPPNQTDQDFSKVMNALTILTQFGYPGQSDYNKAVKKLQEPGTHETVNGKVPTEAEARQMIEKGGGTVDRVEGPHGVNEDGSTYPTNSTHNYDHINYTTASGVKATVKITK